MRLPLESSAEEQNGLKMEGYTKESSSIDASYKDLVLALFS